ncbi:hypothetical protein [Idiomarina xiamenensis]|uniref:Uncharacterized protein n=1 Tax=Idiomarina xiamenensis 10-D-4 TaxID=740709 RepID=K2JMP2_9GAMM|nr:hypothetical protein [Idiomarina xiamenensis]EKE84796.1 hypothetical protein A10D4_04260 [Idiomarina xiamenensis 10-D-4]
MVEQTNIFQARHPAEQQPGDYNELCTALYERELQQLAHLAMDDVRFLQVRLANLPAHIKRAARGMLNSQSPLALDAQNASWQSHQASKPPLSSSGQRCADWFRRHAALGLPVAVFVDNGDFQCLRLDSIDRIQRAAADDKNSPIVALHCNQFGWFDVSGDVLTEVAEATEHWQLLKPEKRIMAAACAGHRWAPKKRLSPRTLSLRELLLAATIYWPNFRRAQRIPD